MNMNDILNDFSIFDKIIIKDKIRNFSLKRIDKDFINMKNINIELKKEIQNNFKSNNINNMIVYNTNMQRGDNRYKEMYNYFEKILLILLLIFKQSNNTILDTNLYTQKFKENLKETINKQKTTIKEKIISDLKNDIHFKMYLNSYDNDDKWINNIYNTSFENIMI